MALELEKAIMEYLSKMKEEDIQVQPSGDTHR
jgi:hypothetical protein